MRWLVIAFLLPISMASETLFGISSKRHAKISFSSFLSCIYVPKTSDALFRRLAPWKWKRLTCRKENSKFLRGGVAGCTTPEMRKSLCRFPRDLVTPRGSSRDYSANPAGTTTTTTSRGWDRTTALMPLLSSCRNLWNRSPQCCTTQLYISLRYFDFTSCLNVT